MFERIKESLAYRLRTLHHRFFPLYDIKDEKLQGRQYFGYVEKYNQDANDYILQCLQENKPLLISKFGTIELDVLEQYIVKNKKTIRIKDYVNFIRGRINYLSAIKYNIDNLCFNAGFFPNDEGLTERFYQENLQAIQQIDILGSYQVNEYLFRKELKNAVRVNLDGYYAPFYYSKPWTCHLKGKRVLVVHPFAEDIQSQYEKRTHIWQDENVLPDFTLITYKAVQSIVGTKTEFATWFDALQKMKDDISKIDFDVALVGCGAYGMPLAAHCKLMGKQAIHLAGWLQVLFGIKGTRWDNNPRVSKFYNEYWIRPSEQNRPQGVEKVENACYW